VDDTRIYRPQGFIDRLTDTITTPHIDYYIPAHHHHDHHHHRPITHGHHPRPHHHHHHHHHHQSQDCSIADEDCAADPAQCQLTVYVSWTGTDRNGNYLTSSSRRFSLFSSYSVNSYFNGLGKAIRGAQTSQFDEWR
jgi:hypothetical protein